MKLKFILIAIALLLSGCNTMPILDLANSAKCATKIATSDSQLTCEFQGKQVVAKK
jgi:starvation-inducible outer membrane lipoprotein